MPSDPIPRSPVVGQRRDQGTIDEFVEDVEIRKLQAVMLRRTPQNLRWAHDIDDSTRSASMTLAQGARGEKGLVIDSASDDLKAYLDNYFKAIKEHHIVQESLEDCMCHRDSVWWKHYDIERGMIIPRQIDKTTLTEATNPWTDEIKWIQVVYIDSRAPKSPTDEAGWRSYEPLMDYFHYPDTFGVSGPVRDRIVKKHIFQDDVIHFDLFRTPPISPVVEVILWKKWMQIDARLASSKYATPLLDAEVELPDNYELGSDEQVELCDQISEDLVRMMNFGSIAHPAQVRVQTLDQSGEVFRFTEYLNYADKIIHRAYFTPSNLSESVGSELATSRTSKDVFGMTKVAIRAFYIIHFTNLALEQLEFAGRSEGIDDFTLRYVDSDQQQKMTHTDEFNALMALFDRGLTRDPNEVRTYLAKFGMELPELTEEEMREIEAMRAEPEEPESDGERDARDRMGMRIDSLFSPEVSE